MLMDRIWALAHMPQITGALIPWDLIMKDKIYIKKRKRVKSHGEYDWWLL